MQGLGRYTMTCPISTSPRRRGSGSTHLLLMGRVMQADRHDAFNSRGGVCCQSVFYL